MNSLTWLTLTAASAFGVILAALLGALLLAMLLGQASGQLLHTDDLRQDF